MKRFLPTIALLFALLFACTASVQAEVKLPTVLDSHMVLQRDVPLKVWGWADAGEAVTVKLGEAVTDTKADAKGKWIGTLPAQKADGKSRKIIIEGSSNRIELSDILIGEVWIGSGQSNMEWRLTSTNGAKEAIAAADHPQIRLFHVPKVQMKTPSEDVKATWKVCNPEAVPNFSAVLYYFGKRLHADLDVPIGLINSSWGGSPIEPWTIAGGQSGGMYNGMIAPLTNVAVKGSIWYQGETNVLRKNGLTYGDKMKALITGWRKSFGNDKLAFHFVQIAPWAGRYEEGQLPALWEAQTATLKIPGTGMAVTTDLVDNIKDIHPRNKVDVGNRLALWALTKDYGRKDLVYSGPLYKSQKIEKGSIRLSFAHVGDGLKARDGKPLSEFQIAGQDDKFVAAMAVVDGDNIVVSAERVKSPTQVRFGWHKVANPNLVNSAGLPASPFQTKNWTGGTGESK
jgi:sialate O-acetylesterase